MPIKIHADLPAYEILNREGVMVMTDGRAERQDIRPLRIGLLNLMPNKEQTETQFARLIGATPLQIDMQFIRMTNHKTKFTSAIHMEKFYRPFSEIREVNEKFDGLIITGAPVEHLDYREVTYWDELRAIFDWTQSHVHSSIGVCWGGMAMLKHFHEIDKHPLSSKAFGCFRHRNMDPANPLLRGFSDDCVIPVSRWTEIRQDDIDSIDGLNTLLYSDDVGPCLVEDGKFRAIYIFNHLEYDSSTLKYEYDRDIDKGAPINVPTNYYPDDDPSLPPQNRWRSHSHLFYGNWINEIYQTTPYEIDAIGN